MTATFRTAEEVKQIEARNLINHWMMFGTSALVMKLGKGWVHSFERFNAPEVFKTKAEAMESATRIVLALARG